MCEDSLITVTERKAPTNEYKEKIKRFESPSKSRDEIIKIFVDNFANEVVNSMMQSDFEFVNDLNRRIGGNR